MKQFILAVEWQRNYASYSNEISFYFQGVTETQSANSEGSTSSRSSGKYTPLGALADLQPGSHNKSSRKNHHQNSPPVTGLVQPQVHSETGSRESRQTTHESQQAHSSNTSSRFSSTIQHQGKLQSEIDGE